MLFAPNASRLAAFTTAVRVPSFEVEVEVMPKRKLRLLASSARLLPKIQTGEVNWSLVEQAYGTSWSEDFRREICEATDYYVMHAAGASATEPIEVPLQHLENISRTASELLRLLTGKSGELSHAMHHANMWLGLKLSDMQATRPNKLDIFREQLAALIAACPNAKEDLQRQTGRGPEATAWELWVCRLTSVLKRNRLRARARKDSDKNKSGPSPFVVLVRELQKRIPITYRQHVQSQHTLADSALATAIQRAQRRLRSRMQ